MSKQDAQTFDRQVETSQNHKKPKGGKQQITKNQKDKKRRAWEATGISIGTLARFCSVPVLHGSKEPECPWAVCGYAAMVHKDYTDQVGKTSRQKIPKGYY